MRAARQQPREQSLPGRSAGCARRLDAGAISMALMHRADALLLLEDLPTCPSDLIVTQLVMTAQGSHSVQTWRMLRSMSYTFDSRSRQRRMLPHQTEHRLATPNFRPRAQVNSLSPQEATDLVSSLRKFLTHGWPRAVNPIAAAVERVHLRPAVAAQPRADMSGPLATRPARYRPPQHRDRSGEFCGRPLRIYRPSPSDVLSTIAQL